jgi:hypothetical protein
VWTGNSWWIGYDVDAAYIVPAAKVEVVDVTWPGLHLPGARCSG